LVEARGQMIGSGVSARPTSSVARLGKHRRPWARRGWPFVCDGRSKDIIIRGREHRPAPTSSRRFCATRGPGTAAVVAVPDADLGEARWSSDRARPVHVPVGSGSGRSSDGRTSQPRGADRLVAHDRPAAHDRSRQGGQAKAEHDLAFGVAIRTDSSRQSPRELDEAMPHRGRHAPTAASQLSATASREKSRQRLRGRAAGPRPPRGCAGEVRLRKSS